MVEDVTDSIVTQTRAACRREAEARFSVERMVDGYEAIYEALETGAPLS